MGIGATTLSSISRPLETVLRWLPLSRRLTKRAAVAAIAADESQGGGLPPGCIGDALSRVVPLRPQVVLSSSQGSPLPPIPQKGLQLTTSAKVPLQKGQTADLFAETLEDPAPGCPAPLRKPLRIVHPRNGTDKGKLVISGRMADVCAELDRLAANEVAVAYG